jgi:hypothetical protein
MLQTLGQSYQCSFCSFSAGSFLAYRVKVSCNFKWGAFYFLIANFFATQNIGGAKDLVLLL